MPGPLEGIRVVELGFWVAGPATAGMLADWGAEVVKLEPPTGDPMRGLFTHAAGIDVPINPPFELDNRGKRSLVLDLHRDDGRAAAHALLARADVFVSNLRTPALAAVGLDFPTLHALNPRLVYCHLTGYGTAGPDRDRPAYDVGAWWARAGVAMALTPKGGEPPQQRGGMGDHTTAITAVSAICAALLARERGGAGQLVSTSLLRTGVYILGWDVNTRLRLGRVESPYDRHHIPNPLVNCYRAGDDRWFWLLGLQADRHWPDLVRALGRPELLDDPRFRDIRVRREHAEACVATLDAIFATRPMAQWCAAFDAAGMWWAPVQTVGEMLDDPQARASGAITRGAVAEGEAEMVASPAEFFGTPGGTAGMAPELGQHTEEVLLELGYDWEQIGRLRENGTLG
ncbi:MAG: CoA transferase [Deltaproteobacteria bacterium]|nr:CoA transferase [Deltaproteobacteria bacterium]